MNGGMFLPLLYVIGSIAILSALGVLVTKDNFYASLFMSTALIMVAATYALFNLSPVFILIVFIFVGAIGIVTVALAATYRTMPERQYSKVWSIPVIITAFFLSFSVYYATHQTLIEGRTFAGLTSLQLDLQKFITPEYILLILFLSSLIILLMLAVLKIGGKEE